MKQLLSLTIFFPFYNDAGTVKKAIDDAYRYGKKVTNNLEVIAIHGGKSLDNTLEILRSTKKKHPDLIMIDKTNNQEGYAVIKHGFNAAHKDWVFYTDGDLQYHLDELVKLVNKQINTNADVVNGYKINRNDNLTRIFLGNCYRIISRAFFKFPIRDIDCDFRLIRRNLFNKFSLYSKNASILPELIKKIERVGGKFAEVPISHYPRQYGQSNYQVKQLLIEKLIGDTKLFFELRKQS